MQTLSPHQTQQVAGGLPWATPAIVALADSACIGPLGFAFGVGYTVGTLIYDNFLSHRMY